MGLLEIDMLKLPLYFDKFAFNLSYLAFTLIFLFLLFVFTLISTSEAGTAREISMTSEKVIEFLDDANNSLAEGNTTKTVSELLMVQRILGQINENSSSIRDSKILIRDTTQALVNGKTDTALANLNLIYRQLANKLPLKETTTSIPSMENKTALTVQISPSNETTVTTSNQTLSKPTPIEKTTQFNESTLPGNETSSTIYNETSMKYLHYKNRLFGIKIQYPESWTVRSYNYNKGGNNTVVGFFSPSKLGSHMENISGITRHFLPYFDIFVFDSKNTSLENVIKGRINRILNHTYSEIIESKPYILKGNLSAYLLVYTATTGEGQLYKKIQIYALINGKVYLSTFTSQEESFSNYLPVIKKMMDSFEIRKRVGDM